MKGQQQGQRRRYRWRFQAVEKGGLVSPYIQLLSPQTWDSFWITLFPYCPHPLHWSLLVSYLKHIWSLSTSHHLHHNPPCPSRCHLLPGPWSQPPKWSPCYNPCLTEQPNQSRKSINQNLSPTWVKTLNGFPVHLKSKHCTMYMYIMWLPPISPTPLPAILTMAFHSPVTLVLFLFLESF